MAGAVPARRHAAALRAVAGAGAGLHPRVRQQRHPHADNRAQYRHLWRQGHHLRGGLLLLSPRPAHPDRGALRHRRAAVRRRADARRLAAQDLSDRDPARGEIRPRERVLRGLHPRHHGLRRPQGHRRQVLGDGHRDLQPGLGPAELHHGGDGVGRAADPGRPGLRRRPDRAAAAVRARDLVVQALRATAPTARRLGGLRLLRAHRGRDRGTLSHHPRLLAGRPLAVQLHPHAQALCLRHGGRVPAHLEQ